MISDVPPLFRVRPAREYTRDDGLSPDKFHKRSQEKNSSPAAGVFLAVQPTSLSRFVLAFRSGSSGRYAILVALLGFSTSGFHRFCTTKPIRSETNKQYGCQLATMVPLGTRGP
jgi:hypothetical protein